MAYNGRIPYYVSHDPLGADLEEGEQGAAHVAMHGSEYWHDDG